MIIKARVIPNSRSKSLEVLADGSYRIKVTEKAAEGRANAAVIAAVASKFNVRKSDVSIIKGLTARNKVIGVDGSHGTD